MRGTKEKIVVKAVGLLSDFLLMHYVGNFGCEVGKRVAVNGKEQEYSDFSKGLQLAPNLKLRFPAKEDTEMLLPYMKLSETPIRLKKYVIECSYEINDESQRNEISEKIHEHINNTLTSLRLLKAGYIDSNTILWIYKSGLRTHASIESQRAVPLGTRQPYYLRTDEISKLTKLISKVEKIDFEKRKAFKIALNRFENSYYEINDEDKLIDYMIAFEALFTEGEKKSQHDVIPIACAMLLGKSQATRRKIREILDYAYGLRNDIVHGKDFRKKLKKDLFFEDFVAEVEELLRNSIKKLA